MVATPPHNRKLGLLGTSLTMARPPKMSMEAMGIVRDEIESILIDSNFYDNTPFSWITLSLRYGLKDDDQPKIGRVSKKYGDLPLSIEIDVNRMRDSDLNGLCFIFREATLKSLIYVADKYRCPSVNLKIRQEAEQDVHGNTH